MDKFGLGPLPASFTSEWFMQSYNDRNVSRLLLLLVTGELLTKEELEKHQDHPFLQLLLKNSSLTIGASGFGDSDTRYGSRLFWNKQDSPVLDLVFELLDLTHHTEDTKMIFIVILEALKKKNILIKANDTDIWQICLLILSKYDSNDVGTIFVKTTTIKLKEDGFETDLINCNEARFLIEEDPEFQQIDKSLRIPYHVLFGIIMGGDTTHGTRGLPHHKGVPILMKYLQWYPKALRKANDDELKDGWLLMIDFECYKKMAMAKYAELYRAQIPIFKDKKNIKERISWLEKTGYKKFEETIGGLALESLGFMLSIENLKYAYGRVMCRLNYWFGADLANPIKYPLWGFVVTILNAQGKEEKLSEPNPTGIKWDDVVNVEPLVTLRENGEPFNTSFQDLFHCEGGVLGALFLKRVQEQKGNSKQKYCKTCHHQYHGTQACAVCGTEKCVETCKRCLHPPHKGKKCGQCKGLTTNNRVHCVEFCRDCNLQKNTQQEGCCCVIQNDLESEVANS
jgi:hypothetical protein